MRKLTLLSCALFPLVTTAQSPSTKTLPAFFEVSRDIQPGETNNFSVPLPRIKASCKLNTHGKAIHFSGHIDKGELTLETTKPGDNKPDVKKYQAGDSISGVEALDTQVFNISIEGYAVGGLTFTKEDGTETITATCSVSF